MTSDTLKSQEERLPKFLAEIRLGEVEAERDAALERAERAEAGIKWEARQHQAERVVAAEAERDAAREEVARLKRIVRADHELKAAQGGSPCVCEICVPPDEAVA